jgi:hypothetical protein
VNGFDGDLAFLAVGGFLLGAVAYCAFYTTEDEPEVRFGYALIGIGVALVVAINTYLDFFYRHVPNWFRVGTMFGYLFVAVGLIFIIRERRSEDPEKHHRRKSPS